jgi:NADPH-dependent ferric siderophore reductase
VSTRARQFDAQVLRSEELSEHLVRLTIGLDEDFASTGEPDEWVGLVVPGQFQVRYYTVRRAVPGELLVDVVLHETGLVTEWVAAGCTGQPVTITEPKGSFAMPDRAEWLMLVGDLTALPAMARIAEAVALPTRIWAEVPDTELRVDYLPAGPEVVWLEAQPGGSRLAEVVRTVEWPPGDGYFWMAGESAQMRDIRKHLMRDRALPSSAYDVMGYWRAASARQPRAVDPGPIWTAGKAAGRSDEEIWREYDEASSTPGNRTLPPLRSASARAPGDPG